MTPSPLTLIRPLGPGPVDVVGDVHGEIDALLDLAGHLGYDGDGRHPDGRRLVFVGDVVDRGPDSPAVFDAVRRWCDAGARMVLGNHEMNLLRGRHKSGNEWFYAGSDGRPVPPDQTPLPAHRREEVLDFFRRQPLMLEREDLLVVHACPHPESAELIRAACCPLEAFRSFTAAVEAQLLGAGLAHGGPEWNVGWQNNNPVLVVVSGLEQASAEPFFAGGRNRWERRLPWWDGYAGERFCVFGHYWRYPVPALNHDDSPFGAVGLYELLGGGRAMCIDYSVGGRFTERRRGRSRGQFETRLAALRWPERELAFDDGQRTALGASGGAG